MTGFVSVVLPTYNEKDNVVEVINRVSKSLGENLKEIIVVDDDSPDKTWKVVQELKNPKCRAIRRIDESGLASALARGVSEAKGDVVVWLDCDLGLSPEDIPGLVNKLDKYDVAIGSRYVKGGNDPRSKAFFSVVLNKFAQLMLGSSVKDYTSGFAAVRMKVFDKFKLSPEGFGEYFIDFVYKCNKNSFKIIEVPCVYKLRKSGISKSDTNIFKFLKLGVQYVLKIIKLRLYGK